MRKLTTIIILIILILACVCALFACANNDNNSSPSNFIVSFNTNGGTAIKSITLKSGSSLVLPEPPTREGYVFTGWYLDKKFEREVNPALFKVVSNVTIFAGWESVTTYRHQITAESYDEGTINIVEPSDARASMGTEVIISVVPESGYELRYDSLKAGNVAVEHESASRYKFIMPAEPVNITAIFDLKPMSVKVMSLIQNGEIVLSTDSARRGDLVTVQAIPDYGYRLTELFIINNEGLSNSEDLKTNILQIGAFYMGSDETYVGAVFDKIDYETMHNVNVVTSKGGDVVVSATESPAGCFVKLDFEAENGYLLDRYTIQGEGFLSIVQSMQEGFIMPDHDVTITASFVKEDAVDESYELIIASPINGSISLINPKNHYKNGEVVQFQANANDGFAFEKAYVNGTPVLGTSFRMPSTKATLTAEFITKGYDVGVVASNCNIKISHDTAYQGEIVYFEIEELEGYKVNPSKITLNGIVLNGNSFVMPADDVTLSVVAYATGSTHCINVQEAVGGNIIVSCAEATIYTKVTVIAEPEEGYRLKKDSFAISYYSQGEKVTKNIGDNFVMMDTDVTVSCQFERIYNIISVDDGRVGLYPSANNIAQGENVYVQFVAHGDIIADSLVVSADFGEYSETLNSARVFELTSSKVIQAGANPTLSFRYVSYDEIDANRLYVVSTQKAQNGTITSPNTARYGDIVKLNVVPNDGYELSGLTISTNDGNYYQISDTFVMPDSAVSISATFIEASAHNFGLKNQYENNLQGFDDAMMRVVYYRENYQIIEAFPSLEINPFVNYIVGVVKVDAKYGHDFYIIEVDDISRVSPIAYDAHDFVARELGVDKDQINVKIKYNYIILSVGGDPNEDFYVYRNGVKAISDHIIYERADGTYGVYAYIGSSEYVSIMESYNGRSISYLSSKAFAEPQKVKGISLGNLSEIGDFALENTSVTYVDLRCVEKLGNGVFKNARSLKAISTSSYNPNYYTLSGVLYERGKNATATLYCYPYAKVSPNNSFEIPSQTQKIAPYAFYGTTLAVISYGGALTTIGEYAFAYSSLKSVKYLSATAIQGVVDFSNSNSNKSIVAELGDGAFRGVYTLNTFYLDSLTEIGNKAISWNGVNDLVINLSEDNNGVVKTNGSPIEMPTLRESTLVIYIPSELEELYRQSNGWIYYQPYFSLN